MDALTYLFLSTTVIFVIIMLCVCLLNFRKCVYGIGDNEYKTQLSWQELADYEIERGL